MWREQHHFEQPPPPPPPPRRQEHGSNLQSVGAAEGCEDLVATQREELKQKRKSLDRALCNPVALIIYEMASDKQCWLWYAGATHREGQRQRTDEGPSFLYSLISPVHHEGHWSMFKDTIAANVIDSATQVINRIIDPCGWMLSCAEGWFLIVDFGVICDHCQQPG